MHKRILLVSLLMVSSMVRADVSASDSAPVTSTTTTTTTVTQPAANSTDTTQPATGAITGAYGPIDTKDPDVQSAAAFAIDQMDQGTLVKIDSAQVQVVAGKNYQLQLIVGQNGMNYRYNVTVFVPLPVTEQPMQLTNVQAMGQVQ